MAGDIGFDPLGLSTIDDVGIDLYWLREAEIKHARVAMLAVAGILQVEIFGPAPGCEMATNKSQMDAFWQVRLKFPLYIFTNFTDPPPHRHDHTRQYHLPSFLPSITILPFFLQ